MKRTHVGVLLAMLLLAGCVERKPMTVVNELPFPVSVELNGMLAFARVNPGEVLTSPQEFTIQPDNHLAAIKLPEGRPPILTAEFSRDDRRSRWFDGDRIHVRLTPADLPNK